MEEHKTVQDIAKAFKAWEAVKFIEGPEEQAYAQLVKDFTDDTIHPSACAIDDDECLSCGS